MHPGNAAKCLAARRWEMPWIPKGKELRRLRVLVGWSVARLAKAAKVSARAIRKLESDDPPETMQAGTVSNLAGALNLAIRKDEHLSDNVRQHGCQRSD